VRRREDWNAGVGPTVPGAPGRASSDSEEGLRLHPARDASAPRRLQHAHRRHPAGDVHIVWDNLNIHHDGPSGRWTAFTERHGGRFHFHHTPIHASWVNQVESWFAILQKRMLRQGVFDSVEALAERVARLIEHWNSSRHPFRWNFKGIR
jgi:transposase